ncbi:hypothetical protein BGZ68_005984, partial [Mortierella alpina]
MIVMEYVEGGNLAEAIVGGALKNWEVKIQIAKGVSLGLAHLHSQNIIHCDIKSSNILLTEHKEAKICDFGLAIKAGESGGGGTLQWMAPELLQDPPQYTSKSDVYALGMVMWEMASESTRPYQGHIPDGVVYCILNGILEEYPDSTPMAYATCIQMCWVIDPDKRPDAMNVLPDTVHSSHAAQDAPDQRQSSARNNGKMDHYFKALEKSLKPNQSAGFLDLLKDSGMLHDNKTMDWFDSSASGSGSAKAMFKMGTRYYSGRGVQSDYGEALEWYLAASEAGIAVAMLKISQMYQHGRGVDQDDKEAISWNNRGEEALSGQAKHNNRLLHHDAAVSEHHTKTMQWFNNNEGNEAAITSRQIGNMYILGDDLEQDYGQAMKWYLKASDAGDATAMRYIGIMYDNGQNVQQNSRKAMEWYLKASEAGDITAMINIGLMYVEGQGIEQDYGKAMEWFLKASISGDATAMRCIGIMYCNGRSVEQDYGKAMEWYIKASDAGDAIAMRYIGIMYDNGRGVKKDHSKAVEWYIKASDVGDAIAMRYIGI